MSHLHYLPGDPRLLDQLVYELKSKGIFDQFRKDCIADVDTRPAYQNLRQRVESSVTTFLSRQVWKPDLNKNQLREKLRKHILDGNYLEQGVERIVDQVVNPKVSSVFIPQVEDLVYNYLGITRKKSSPVITAETSNGKTIAENDLLPTDLEAVSPGSVHDDKDDRDAVNGHDTKMDVDVENTDKENINGNHVEKLERKDEIEENLSKLESDMSVDNITEIPIPSEDIKLEDIPVPDTSPSKIDLNQIVIPEDMKTTDIPIPSDEQIPLPKDEEKEQFFKPVGSDNEGSSSDSSSIRRNMSPLTPIRNFNNENSYDAQQAFDNDSNDTKAEIKEPSTFRFSIENKSNEQSNDAPKTEKKDEQTLSYQFSTQVNLNTFNTPLYDDSSNSNNLQIDYESDVNSKTNLDSKLPESEQNSRDSKKDKKQDDKKSSHKSSHRSRNSSSKDKKYDSKRSSRDSSRHDKKSSRDESKSKSSDKDKSKEKMDTKENTEKKESRVEVSEKKESKESSDKPKEDKKDYKDSSDKKDRDSSKYKSSHKSSTKDKDSKSHRSSSSNHRHSSKYSDEKKSSSSSQKYRSERNSDKSSKEKSSRDSKSSSHRTDKDRKSSSSSKKSDDKDKEKKSKKDTDDHYSVSGRGNHTRRSTDRDSNDGSSSSKGSQNTSNTKSSDNKKESKSSSSKSGSTTTSSESTSPSEKENIVNDVTDAKNMQQQKPVRVEDHLEMPFASPPRLPFVPDVTLKKPRFAANLQEAKKMIKMRKFLEEEQKRMNQEAALLLEFQANVRPSLSQVYSSIPGPELEFACMQQTNEPMQYSTVVVPLEQIGGQQIEENVVLQVDMKTNEFISEGEVAMESNVEEISVKNEAMMAAEEARHIEETNAIIETLSEDDSINENTNRKSELNAQTSITEAEKQNNIGEGKAESLDDIINEINKDATKKDYNEFENKSIGNEMQSTSDIFDITVITEELSEDEGSNGQKDLIAKEMYRDIIDNCPEESLLKFFAEHEKFNAEMERHKFVKFMKTISEITSKSKMYLVNCNKHTETLFKEVSQAFGDFEIVNYHKNGNLKLHNVTTNVVKDVNISDEITLPVDTGKDFEIRTAHSQIFSPVKSECSFELASDYDAKLEEMVNRTSRQEIMEIILGNVALDESPSKMPRINYCMDSSIESDEENTLKRKYVEVESSVNNNRTVLTPNKIRKHSSSDQISSTTEETLEAPNTKLQNSTRSKYLGRAKKVGLPKPKRCNLPNSPSSDKSVENYEQNAQQTPNGKIKTQRNKIQRYDTSDLYKPKLHFLSRRNNIT